MIPTETSGTTDATEPASRPPGRPYWLIAKNSGGGGTEVLTLGCAEVLPVFSFEEEAEMFLRLGDAGDGWRVRESRAGELISLLYGPCADVKEVALDPLPEMVAERTVGLVSLPRQRFIGQILGRPPLELYEPRRG